MSAAEPAQPAASLSLAARLRARQESEKGKRFPGCQHLVLRTQPSSQHMMLRLWVGLLAALPERQCPRPESTGRRYSPARARRPEGCQP